MLIPRAPFLMYVFMAKKNTKSQDNRSFVEQLISEENWGEGEEFFGLRSKANSEVEQFRATTTGGQKRAAEDEEIASDPEFSPLAKEGITADDLRRFIELKQGL